MKKYPYFDAHCDTFWQMHKNKELTFTDSSLMVKIKDNGKYMPRVQVFAQYNNGSFSEDDMLNAFCFMKKQFEAHSEYISGALCTSDIDENAKNGKMSAIMSIEGMGNQCDITPDSIKKFWDAGVRIAGISWNNDNVLCGGIGENNKGFTALGKEVLKEMENHKMMLDVSHMSDQSFYDAFENYSLPICATHSNSRNIYAHNRNLTDEQFGEIVKRGGVCGINFYPLFLFGEKSGIKNMISHIEHFLSLGGENNIGLGSDFDGIDITPDEIKISDDVCKLFDALLALNYKESLIEKIAFYNFYTFLKKFEI